MGKVSNIGEERLVRALTGGGSKGASSAEKPKAPADSFTRAESPSALAAIALQAITGKSPSAVYQLAGMAIGQAGAEQGVTKEGVDEAAKIWAELGYK